MVKQFCDRCGRLTGNGAAFLLPASKAIDRSYNVNGTWFGDDTIILCDYCMDDFERFRVEHGHFNTELESDNDWKKVNK